MDHDHDDVNRHHDYKRHHDDVVPVVEVLLRGIAVRDVLGPPELLAFWWTDPVEGLLHRNTVAQLVAFIEDDRGRVTFEVDGRRLEVGVVEPDRQGRRTLRARVDGRWTDDLLRLPRM